MENINIVIQALDKANQKGAFTLQESKLIADALIELKQTFNYKEKTTENEPESESE